MMTLPRITRFMEMDNVRQPYQELNAMSSMQVLQYIVDIIT